MDTMSAKVSMMTETILLTGPLVDKLNLKSTTSPYQDPRLAGNTKSGKANPASFFARETVRGAGPEVSNEAYASEINLRI